MTDGGRSYITTYVHPWHTEWSRRTEPFDVRTGRLKALAGLTRSSGPAILHGAVGFRRGYVDLIAGAALARKGGPVFLADATWEPGSRSFDRLMGVSPAIGYDAPPRYGRRLAREMIKAIDSPRTHYGVLSRDELETFPSVWGVDPDRVHFTAFSATSQELGCQPGGSGVFASGNSLRDYRALVTAAPIIRSTVTLATSLKLPEAGPRPDNLQTGFFSFAEHEARARDAAVVVVPLLNPTERSAGQQTYLNAMARAKAVVVTEAPGVRDYITDGETGLIVANTSQALAAAINRLLEDEELARRLGGAARETVQRDFTGRAYIDRLLSIADSL